VSINVRLSTYHGKHGNFHLKHTENTYAKGRALMQMYRVVPQIKRGNFYVQLCIIV